MSRSDWVNDHAHIWLELAEVQRAAGLHDDATAAVAEARRLYEAKGNVAAISRLNVQAAR
jgi:hypothetical protein